MDSSSDDSDSHKQLRSMVSSIIGSRRILCLNGAGCSTSAGIPDFRSKDGLYALAASAASPSTPSRSSGRCSGKDMFSVSVYNSQGSTAQFYRFIGALHTAAERAQPTQTHRFIKLLENKRRLLRCYTQNIDGLEERAGMRAVPLRHHIIGDGEPPRKKQKTSTPAQKKEQEPRLVHLHGRASLVRCSLCSYTSPLTSAISSSYSAGESVPCPSCAERRDSRIALGRRANVAVGALRPAITLYGQQAGEEECRIGEIVQRDMDKDPDCLIVFGTSLKVSD